MQPATEVPMAKKKGEPRTTKKEKAPKEPKPPQVVFAFRLAEADRDLIHKAAGPGKATRFVLDAALSAANKVLASK